MQPALDIRGPGFKITMYNLYAYVIYIYLLYVIFMCLTFDQTEGQTKRFDPRIREGAEGVLAA